jgi:single-strand DNA-binding protein
MKSITIAGNIGKDAEVRTMQDGTKVAGWTVAVDDGWGEKKRTIWFDCSMFGVRGERIAQHINKGGKICVSGEFSTREHNGVTYPTIRVSDVTLQGGGQSNQGDGGQRGGNDQSGGAPDQYERNKLPREGAPAGGRFDDDDEIPF